MCERGGSFHEESTRGLGPIRRLALVAGAFSCRAAGGRPSWNSARTRRAISASWRRGSRAIEADGGHSRRAAPFDRAGERGRQSDPSARRVCRLAGPVVEPYEPDALLDGGIRGISGSGQWTVQGQPPIALDGHPGRDVRFAVTLPPRREGIGPGADFLVGSRLYQAIMVGPASKVTEEELDQFVKSFELLQKVPVTPRRRPPLAPGRHPGPDHDGPWGPRRRPRPRRPAPGRRPEPDPRGFETGPGPGPAPPPARAPRPAPIRTPPRREAGPDADARAPARPKIGSCKVGNDGPDT